MVVLWAIAACLRRCAMYQEAAQTAAPMLITSAMAIPTGAGRNWQIVRSDKPDADKAPMIGAAKGIAQQAAHAPTRPNEVNAIFFIDHLQREVSGRFP